MGKFVNIVRGRLRCLSQVDEMVEKKVFRYQGQQHGLGSK